MLHYIFQTTLNLLGFPKHIRNVEFSSQTLLKVSLREEGPCKDGNSNRLTEDAPVRKDFFIVRSPFQNDVFCGFICLWIAAVLRAYITQNFCFIFIILVTHSNLLKKLHNLVQQDGAIWETLQAETASHTRCWMQRGILLSIRL